MTQLHDTTERLKDTSAELQRVLGDLGDRWLQEGRQQARRAIGGYGAGTLVVTLVAGIAAGVVVGAAAGLLFAPKRGAEIREEIARRARERDGGIRRPLGNGAVRTAEPIRSVS